MHHTSSSADGMPCILRVLEQAWDVGGHLLVLRRPTSSQASYVLDLHVAGVRARRGSLLDDYHTACSRHDRASVVGKYSSRG